MYNVSFEQHSLKERTLHHFLLVRARFEVSLLKPFRFELI